MKIKYSPDFLRTFKKLDSKIRKSFKKKLLLFSENTVNPKLHNKTLRNPWLGFKSIRVGDIKNDYRAIYEELVDDDDTLIARFVAIGTHKELFQKNKTNTI